LPSTHQILGLKFFGGTSREAVEQITRTGGLLVAPAAPSMVNLCRDEEYRRALLASDVAIADSGFMVLLWKFFTSQRVPRISGLEYVKRLLEHESVRQAGATMWVAPTAAAREKTTAFLGASGVPVTDADVYIAPRYGRPVEDETLLGIVRQRRPRHVVIAVGGGVQDKLGLYLMQRLDYRPAIHCIGAALGFLTGDQVRIPGWVDRYYFGWFLRSLAQPGVIIPRFWSARKLPWLIWHYRDQLPPLHRRS
jgi:UDP-N-acetyl-D-mannosaminuronic acid transferase (WecB/TagA/CpsF family)